MPLRTIIVGAILAAAALAAAAGGVASGARDTGPANEATPSALSAGPYTAVVRRITTPDGAPQAVIDLTDASGRAVAGKPLSGILVYEGTAAGHEHHDILIGREQGGGRYALTLSEAVPGPWLLTIVVGDEGRAAYLFAVP